MISQLVVIVVVEAFDGGFLDGAVHPFDLTIGPGMPDLGKPVVNLMFPADTVKDVLEGINVPFVIGELDAIEWTTRRRRAETASDQQLHRVRKRVKTIVAIPVSTTPSPDA